MNQENVKECSLPKGRIRIIKRRYRLIRKDVRLAVSLYSKRRKIDEKYYREFKSRLNKEFPEFLSMVGKIEKKVDIKRLKNYLYSKKMQIASLTGPPENFEKVITRVALEIYVKKHEQFPSGQELKRIMGTAFRTSLPRLSAEVTKSLKGDLEEMLAEQQATRLGFEDRLYHRWRKPLDLLEALIRISLEAGQECKQKLMNTADKTNKHKRSALILVHARALQIANEILTLLKAGYADGANARWRSLHELAVISFFLKANSNEVAERYLKHDTMRIFKDAKDYQKYHKKLRYPALSPKILRQIKKEHDRLLRQYTKEFEYKNGFEWIPKAILLDRSFRNLEEHVRLPQYHPFYNLSSAAVHGGSRGFYRIGLMKNWQRRVLLVGPTNYGLADPLMTTAISLLHVTVCLLTLQPSYERLMAMNAMNDVLHELEREAVEIQHHLEKEKSTWIMRP